MLEVNNAIDAPDSRDRKFSEYLSLEEYAQGNSLTWLEDLVKIQNQGSVGACTDFGITHISNGYNVKERYDHGETYPQLDAMKLWNEGDKIPSLQAGLKRHKKRWLISGRMIADGKTVDEMNNQVRRAIKEMGKLIYSWCSKGDRSLTRKNKILTFRTDNQFVGHCRDIVNEVEYAWEMMYKAPNSYGDKRWDKGYFYVRKLDIMRIYSKYIVIDKDDSGLFEYYKALQLAKNFIKAGKEFYKFAPADLQLWLEGLKISEKLMLRFKFTEQDL